MDSMKKGWFSEFGQLWPGQTFSLECEEVLFQGKSPYQEVLAFRSKTYGNVLVLDGVIQATDRDEFAYQEMFAHLALCSHPDPKKVLVIGGGDGGILREIAKHQCVEEITICEIDQMVIDTAKKFLPEMAKGFDDPRVTLFMGDGCAYLEQKKNEYDVIIVDSSDPVDGGPAETLYAAPFYRHLKEALRPGGLVCTQAECQWIHLNIIAELIRFSRNLFSHVEYAYTTIPSYPCGQIGFLLASTGDSCKTPKRTIDESLNKYYNEEIHNASFVLPSFVRRAIYKDENSQ
ncbi:spermidine synthase [Planoprotostelium fungivorum]|uniref:Spermidine synthase n=1 Tax=Planoprotostelium fungivorum TaxID=1890364 RepID=A0A2P6NZM5_9EUKA|nr:spermidine synthase [Planoprotostelium fungivorum]